jgi:hypothetical protein
VTSDSAAPVSKQNFILVGLAHLTEQLVASAAALNLYALLHSRQVAGVVPVQYPQLAVHAVQTPALL